jgi:hypothetical protein
MAAGGFASVAVQLGPFNGFIYLGTWVNLFFFKFLGRTTGIARENVGVGEREEEILTVVKVNKPFPREFPDEERDDTNDSNTTGDRQPNN